MPLCALTHAFVVGRARRNAEIPYPNYYATAEQAAENVTLDFLPLFTIAPRS